MSQFSPPLIHDSRSALPVLLSIPHSGRDYPAELINLSRHGKAGLEALEDPLVDRLAWRAMAAGIGAVIAQTPRAAIDCNRSTSELDPLSVAGFSGEAVGPRARAGLGLIPARAAPNGLLWRRPIDGPELEARIDDAHRPYHDALAERLDALHLRHGQALLLDCHSMPPRPRSGPQLVIGDRYGTSAAGWLSAEAARIARTRGFSVALNDPFAGGQIVGSHGQPAREVHALQLEICRGAYCQRDLRTPGPGFERVAMLIEALALGLGEALLARSAMAAE